MAGDDDLDPFFLVVFLHIIILPLLCGWIVIVFKSILMTVFVLLRTVPIANSDTPSIELLVELSVSPRYCENMNDGTQAQHMAFFSTVEGRVHTL